MSRRGAFTIMELLATCLVLATLMVVCLQLVRATVVARRASQQRQSALEEASNTLERIAALEYGELTAPRTTSLVAVARVASRLPGGRAEVAVEQAGEDLGGKRVAVSVFWRNVPEEPEKMVRLVAWKYPLPSRRGGR